MSRRTRHFIRAVTQANGGAYPSANDMREVLEKVLPVHAIGKRSGKTCSLPMSARTLNGAKNPDRSPYRGLAQRLGAK